MKKIPKILSILLAVCLLATAVIVPVSATEPETYTTRNDFSWGVNGHTSSSYYMIPEEEQLALAAKLGAKLYRVDVNSLANLSKIDKIVKAANSYGMDVMLCVTYNSSTATPAEMTDLFGGIARHYSSGDFGRVKYIQLGNETESHDTKTGENGDEASDYDTDKLATTANRLIAAYNAVKAVTPAYQESYQTIINYGYTHCIHVKLLADKGVLFDVIGIDWYSDMQTEYYGGLTNVLNSLNGYDCFNNKKVIVCESNDFRPTAQESQTLSQTLKDIMAQAYASNRVIGMCFYELLDEPDHGIAEERNFGLVSVNGSDWSYQVKPKYTSIQTLIGGNNSITPSAYVPSANYPSNTLIHNSAYDFNASYISTATPISYTLNQVINASDYDFLEFDAFVESSSSDAVNIRTFFKKDGSSYIYKGGISITPNTWQHVVVEMSSFTKSNSDGTGLATFVVDGLTGNQVFNAVNIALTTLDVPQKSSIFQNEKVLNGDMTVDKYNGTSPTTQFGETVDFTVFDYLEFDIYMENNTATTRNSVDIMFYNTSNNWFKHNTGALTLNKWNHVVLSTKSGWDKQNDATTMTTANRYVLFWTVNDAKYFIRNMALTKDITKSYSYDVVKELPTGDLSRNGYTSSVKQNFGETLDFSTYGYLEFDAYYVKSGRTNLQLMAWSSANKWAAYTAGNLVSGTWNHIVIPIHSGWSYQSGFDAALLKEITSYSFNADLDEIIVKNMAFTDAQYLFKANIKLGGNYSKTGYNGEWVDLGEVVDFTSHDYLEFDVYYEAERTNLPLMTYDKDRSGSGWRNPTVNNVVSGVWNHVVLPISNSWGGSGDMTITRYIKFNCTLDTLSLKNFALTDDYDAKNIYVPAKAVSGNMTVDKFNGTSPTTQFGEAVDFTAYDYLEFDIYMENNTATARNSVELMFYNTSNNWFKQNTGALTLNKWNHVVLSTKSGWGKQNDSTTMTTANRYCLFWALNDAKYYIRNMTFTNEPEANYTNSLAKELSGDYFKKDYKGDFIDFGEIVDFTDYDFLEFDMYYNEDGKTSIPLMTYDKDKSGSGWRNPTISDVTSGEWNHVVLPISKSWSGSGDLTVTKYIKFNTNLGVLCVRNVALTNAKRIYNKAKNISGNFTKDTYTGAQTSFGETLDFTAYDFVEFDVYYEAEGRTNLQLMTYSSGIWSAYTIQNTVSGEWRHVVIPTNSGWSYQGGYDANLLKTVGSYKFNANLDTVTVKNMAFTNISEMNNTHYLGKVLSGNINIDRYSGTCPTINIGESVNFTDYDYLEFDIYMENNDVSAKSYVDIQIFGSSGTKTHSTGTLKLEKWNHVVISANDGWNYDGTLTGVNRYTLFSCVTNAKYYICNLALTNEEPPVEDIWGDANGDGEVNILDLVVVKKMAAGEIDIATSVDFNEDGSIDTYDLVPIIEFIIGKIDSLDPTFLAQQEYFGI